jgi:hypothetical protein
MWGRFYAWGRFCRIGLFVSGEAQGRNAIMIRDSLAKYSHGKICVEIVRNVILSSMQCD